MIDTCVEGTGQVDTLFAVCMCQCGRGDAVGSKNIACTCKPSAKGLVCVEGGA
jgi:hypothetical protein